MPEPTSTFCARAETDRIMANSANPVVLIKLRMWVLLRNRSRLPEPSRFMPHAACYKPPVGREHPMTPFLPPLPGETVNWLTFLLKFVLLRCWRANGNQRHATLRVPL